MEARGSKITLPISDAFANKLFRFDVRHRHRRNFDGRDEERLQWFLDPEFDPDQEAWANGDWPSIQDAYAFIACVKGRAADSVGLATALEGMLEAPETTIKYYTVASRNQRIPAFEIYGVQSPAGTLIVFDCLADNLPADVKGLVPTMIRGLKEYDARAEGKEPMNRRLAAARRAYTERNVLQDPLRPSAYRRRNSLGAAPKRIRPNLGNAEPGRPALPENVLERIKLLVGNPENAGLAAAIARLLRGGTKRKTRRRRT